MFLSLPNGRLDAALRFAAGRGPTHPSSLLSEFLRWILCSGQISPAAVTPTAVVTMHQLAFAPLRQLLSRGTDAAMPHSLAEEVTTQQRMVSGILWCICQVRYPLRLRLQQRVSRPFPYLMSAHVDTSLAICASVQATCNIGSRSWLRWAGLTPDGPWLLKTDSKTRRAAVLQLLPMLQPAHSSMQPEPDLILAHARADVIVGLCLLLQQQLSMPGTDILCVVKSIRYAFRVLMQESAQAAIPPQTACWCRGRSSVHQRHCAVIVQLGSGCASVSSRRNCFPAERRDT